MTLKPDGRIEWVEGDPFIPVINVKRRRLSHIVPTHPFKRIAFRLLRHTIGDRGRVADWTRRWNGPVRVTILKTGATQVFPSRTEAIQWELEQVKGAKFEL